MLGQALRPWDDLGFWLLGWPSTVAGGLAGWAAARLAGADRCRYVEAWAVPVLSFTPQATAGAWAGALLIRGRVLVSGLRWPGRR
jgi:hypothetical protein